MGGWGHLWNFRSQAGWFVSSWGGNRCHESPEVWPIAGGSQPSVEHLLCASHCSRWFTHSYTFNCPNSMGEGQDYLRQNSERLSILHKATQQKWMGEFPCESGGIPKPKLCPLPMQPAENQLWKTPFPSRQDLQLTSD